MEHTQHIATGVQGLKGNEILAMILQTQEGTVVAIKPLCSALKVDWMSQYRKVTTDTRFNYSHITMVGADGKQRDMICLPAEQVPMWINSINSNKVAEEKRQALLELHKFFGHALNEFTRGRYVTQEQFAKLGARSASLERQLIAAMNVIQQLTAELGRQAKANGFQGKAASYEMHARRAELKH